MQLLLIPSVWHEDFMKHKKPAFAREAQRGFCIVLAHLPCTHFGDSGQVPACSAGAKMDMKQCKHILGHNTLQLDHSGPSLLPEVSSGSGPLLPRGPC